jgi:ABC-2 type transport system ATP-binding protein
MQEVEEICDDVTIMSEGSVSFHGSISDLRAMAPDPGHILATADDDRAAAMAARRPELSVTRGIDGLRVVGPEGAVASLVAELVGAGVHLHAFTPTETPLEALFFMLTDDAEHADAEHRHLMKESAR